MSLLHNAECDHTIVDIIEGNKFYYMKFNVEFRYIAIV